MSLNKISLTQLEPCEHRVGDICPHLLENVNLSFNCYPAPCNVFCPKTDGPKSPHFRRGSPNLSELVFNRTNYLVLVKVAGRGPVTYSLSYEVQDILSELELHVPRGARLLLGGSVIHDQWSGNDIDAIVEFDKIDEQSVREWEKLKNGPAQKVRGIPVHWLPRARKSPALFPILDPQAKVVSGCPPLLHPESIGDGVELMDSGHPLKPHLPLMIKKFTRLVEKHYVPLTTNSTITPEGLGDVVARAIKAVSFGRLEPCKGCEQRREALNKVGRKLGIGVEK